MNHIQTLETRDLAASLNNGGCGECQTSCQSACKTSSKMPCCQIGSTAFLRINARKLNQ